MAINQWRPLSKFTSWPDLWDNSDLAAWFNQPSTKLDVYETEDEVKVEADVAGVQADDIDLTFEDGVLWIKADRTVQQGDQDKKHYRKSSWSYNYKVAVPGKVDLEQEPTAEVEDGVLTVTFKKAEASKPRKLTVTAR